MSTLKDKFFKRFIPYTFNQAGDTIVEVMIALAVLSLSLGISYEAANGGINQSVNAQEHAQALGLIDAQVEELRSAIDNNTAVIPNGSNDFFCMSNNGSLISFNVSPAITKTYCKIRICYNWDIISI